MKTGKPSLLRAVFSLAVLSVPLGAFAASPDEAARATMAAKAEKVFGKQPGQSFDPAAVKVATVAPRTDTMTVTLAPGKGTEIKALVDAGQTIIYHWTASADVLVDMHGERPGATDEYTSYDIDAARKEGSGVFTAAFNGAHGWFWKNRGSAPVTVTVMVTGFHKQLARPGH